MMRRWVLLHPGGWILRDSKEAALVWYTGGKELLLEVEVHKHPPVTLSLEGFVKGYVAPTELPMMLCQVNLWADGLPNNYGLPRQLMRFLREALEKA